VPGDASQVTIDDPYDRRQAKAVIRAAIADYEEEYGG
jgi:hypothetical protein